MLLTGLSAKREGKKNCVSTPKKEEVRYKNFGVEVHDTERVFCHPSEDALKTG